MSGWLKTGSASVMILLLTSAKKLLKEKIAHEICSQWEIYCEQKFAHGESWITLHSKAAGREWFLPGWLFLIKNHFSVKNL
jgi:hypothetical protein